jgi:tRNA nucleotidyltransferase/poly(A) polymerase
MSFVARDRIMSHCYELLEMLPYRSNVGCGHAGTHEKKRGVPALDGKEGRRKGLRGTMRIDFGNPSVDQLASLYAREGVEARPVGGAVRDRILGLQPKDFDFAVDALPEDVMAIAERHGLKVIPTGLKHGTVTVVHDGEGYEFTTLRTDSNADGRWADVSFINDFRLDAARRDFTFNAMSADHTGQLHDYFGGVDDLKMGRVKFVGDPEDRVQEDYLRILRFFRFRARFGNGSSDDEHSLAAIANHAGGLSQISAERIWKETSQILSSETAEQQLILMERLGVSKAIDLPQFDIQRNLKFSRIRKATNDAAILLGSLFDDPASAEAFASSWKLSNTERLRVTTAAAVQADLTRSTHYWRCKQVEGLDSAAAIPVLKVTNRMEAAQAMLADVPVFPLQARDLISIGHEPGVKLGQELKRLTKAWKDSEFTLSKVDLIEMSDDIEEKPRYGI